MPMTDPNHPRPAHFGRRKFLVGGAAALAACAVPTRQIHAEAGAPALPPLRILFFTDVHAMSEKGAPEKMAATASRIANETCDVIIGGGDYLHGGFGSTRDNMDERLTIFRNFLTSLNRPLRPMIGNHDLIGAMPGDGSPPAPDPRAPIMELLGIERPYYSFEAGGYRFFVVDSVEVAGGKLRYRGWVGEEQMAWLRETLEKTPADQPLVLCSHIPLRTTFIQDREGPTAALPANLVVGNANEVLALFSAHRLVLVLQGHLHTDEQIRWNGLEFVQGGAVSGAWWGGANHGTEPGYGMIELGPSPAGWRYPC
jgi:3',5'-cyclic AMP phosphodiesterase CpdA